MQPVQYRRAVTVSGSPQHGTDRRACSHRRDVANNYELLMLDALALQPVFASSWPVWHVFTLRDDDALQSKLRACSNIVGPSSSRCSLKSDWRAGGKSADKLRLRQSKPSQWSRSNTNNESGPGGRLSGPTAESLKLEMPFWSLTTIPHQAARTDAQFLQRCSDAAKRLRPVKVLAR